MNKPPRRQADRPRPSHKSGGNANDGYNRKSTFEPRLSQDRTNSTGRMQMLDTWQFVRVMVALEDRGKRGALWQHWSTTWRELDAELTSLAETEFDAYSTLMMRHRLELSLPTPALKLELIANLRVVVKQLNDRCREKGIAPSQRQDMQFEASELKALLRELDPPPPPRVDPEAEAAAAEEEAIKNAKLTPNQIAKSKHTEKRDKHGKPGPKLQRGKPSDSRNSGSPDSGKQRVKRPRPKS